MAYESFEEKYLGREKAAGKFLREAGKMTLGYVIGMHTIPTRVRKIWNDETRLQKEKYGKDISKVLGAAAGTIGGMAYLLGHSLAVHQHASNGDYTPAIILGATNLASLVWELGVKSGKRQQREN